MLTLRKEEVGGFILYGKSDLWPNFDVELQFDTAQIHTLGLLCVHHFPDIEPRYAVASESEAYRLTALRLLLADDRSIRILLREVHCETLINFLWYVADGELTKKFFRNMTQRAAELVFDDLEQRYCNLDPDKASMFTVKEGWEAILDVVKIYDRLADEGQVLSI